MSIRLPWSLHAATKGHESGVPCLGCLQQVRLLPAAQDLLPKAHVINVNGGNTTINNAFMFLYINIHTHVLLYDSFVVLHDSTII